MPFRVTLPPDSRRPLTLEELFAAAAARCPQVPVPPPDPRAGLWRLLDRLEALQVSGAKVERHELMDKVLDVFRSFPVEARAWLDAWRRDHQRAKLA